MSVDWEFNNLRFLGGQIGVNLPDYMEISQTDPKYAFILWYLKNRERWKQEKDKRKVLLEKLAYLGKINRVKWFSEISLLSMMLGDKANEEFDASGKEQSGKT